MKRNSRLLISSLLLCDPSAKLKIDPPDRFAPLEILQQKRLPSGWFI
tara:strand:- start:181 stop:321 length:141 start_codon:yes stop_codon:yes gene_type:complete